MLLLNKYIYYTITERLYYLIGNRVDRFNSMCIGVKTTIINGNIGHSNIAIITNVTEFIMLIYGMDYDESCEHINNYFMNNEFLKYGIIVQNENIFFNINKHY